jgi:hypothetical protein
MPYIPKIRAWEFNKKFTFSTMLASKMKRPVDRIPENNYDNNAEN